MAVMAQQAPDDLTTSQISIVDIATGKSEVVAGERSHDTGAQWLSDGSLVYVSDADGWFQVVRRSPDGRDRIILTDGEREHGDEAGVGPERRGDRDIGVPGRLLAQVDPHVVARREQQRHDDRRLVGRERVEGCRDIGLLHIHVSEPHVHVGHLGCFLGHRDWSSSSSPDRSAPRIGRTGRT